MKTIYIVEYVSVDDSDENVYTEVSVFDNYADAVNDAETTMKRELEERISEGSELSENNIKSSIEVVNEGEEPKTYNPYWKALKDPYRFEQFRINITKHTI